MESKEHQVVRYIELVRRLSEFHLINQADWKPEYNQEIGKIRAELAQLRVILGMDKNE